MVRDTSARRGGGVSNPFLLCLVQNKCISKKRNCARQEREGVIGIRIYRVSVVPEYNICVTSRVRMLVTCTLAYRNNKQFQML